MLAPLVIHPSETFRQLLQGLEAEPGAAQIRDENGELPLQVLRDNVDLVGTAAGRQTATNFAFKLTQAFPDGITLAAKNSGPNVRQAHDSCMVSYKSLQPRL